MNDIEIAPDAEALAHLAAEAFCSSATRAIAQRGKFTVALSGGRTPKALYQLLAKGISYHGSLRWEDVYFFFGDERHVPPEHTESNFRMVNEALFKPASVPLENIFRVHAELPDADEAAAMYQKSMVDFFSPDLALEDGFPVFDLILLGTGPDGHTASLFPGSDALIEKRKWVVANWVAKFASRRITLTLPVLNRAREVLVLVSGEDKASIIKEIFNQSSAESHYPIQQVAPRRGRKHWLLDGPAYSLMKVSDLPTEPNPTFPSGAEFAAK
jgi:6-phosphogluconolactonase